MQKVRNISLPNIPTFSFISLLIKGKDVAEETHRIDDILAQTTAQKPSTPPEQASSGPSSKPAPAPAPQQEPAQSSSSTRQAPASQKDTILIALKIPDEVAKKLAQYGNTVMNTIRPDLAKIGLSFTYIDRTKQYLKLFEGTTDDLLDLILKIQLLVSMHLSGFSANRYTYREESNSLITTISDATLADNLLEVEIGGPAHQNVSNVLMSLPDNSIDPNKNPQIAVGEFKLLNKDTTDANKPQIMKILQDHPEIMQKIKQIPLPQIDKTELTTLLFRVTSGNIQKEIKSEIKNIDGYDENSDFVRAARAEGIIK